jgi:hypothetical protein
MPADEARAERSADTASLGPGTVVDVVTDCAAEEAGPLARTPTGTATAAATTTPAATRRLTDNALLLCGMEESIPEEQTDLGLPFLLL